MAKLVFFKEWRETTGLTQLEAAEFLGIDRSYLSKMESGNSKKRRRYNEDFLETAARLYKCQVSDLYTHPADPTLELVKLARSIPKDQVAAAITALKLIKKKKSGD